jgi:hypothetical protein
VGERPIITADSAKFTLRVTVAEALAQAFIVGVTNTSENGRPLTELQQIDLLASSHMAHGETVKSAEASIDTEALLFGPLWRATMEAME